ncbi:hypothetical protein JCM30760_00690 [Thiomicrorhabdus hydrogeniphila]
MTLSLTVTNLFGDKHKKRQLNALFAEKHLTLYRLAYAWCHQASQAEDLVQETFLKALEKSKDIADLEHLDAFLVTIMRNTFLDIMRFNKRWQWTNEDEIDEYFAQNCSETEMIAEQKADCLFKAMASLPFEQREVIALVDLQGFSYQQIAQITDTPIGTVMSRISRGRENLLKRMKHIEKYGTNIVPMRR